MITGLDHVVLLIRDIAAASTAYHNLDSPLFVATIDNSPMAVHSFNRCRVHSQYTVQDRFSGIVASYQKVSHILL